MPQAPLARRSTKGPLDVDDCPVVDDDAPPPTAPGDITAEAANIPVPPTPFSLEHSHIETVAVPPPPPTKDYNYLLRPEIYHPLSQLELPPVFRTPQYQPHPATPMSELLSHYKFRSAATAAALRLCTPPPPPPPDLFSLVYIRLACLTLTGNLPLAAEESKALQDVSSPFYIDNTTGKNVLPWELRVLAVRLQGVGFGDVRRGVGGYYDLAKEARARVKESTDVEEKQIWKERLQELGLYVANALIESGDMGAAARHLENLHSKAGREENDTLNGRLALLYIDLGDVDAAQRCLSSSTPSNANSLKPLLSMAEGRYSDAAEEWKALPPSDIVTQNLAVCLFYTSEVSESIDLLEELVKRGRSFNALTFNLATVYELCSEKGRDKKGELAERVARSIEGQGGGERRNVDFKL